jgi:3D (Asp-Asp-Asp) domain-containing protein
MKQNKDNARTFSIRSAKRTIVAGMTVAFMCHLSGAVTEGRPPADKPGDGRVSPGPAMEFQATAYCEKGITKSGVPAAPGVAAADLSVLPLGSLVQVEGLRHRGIYRVMDTGRLVKGKIIDIYMSDLQKAVEFGRQKVLVSIIRYGAADRWAKLAVAD